MFRFPYSQLDTSYALERLIFVDMFRFPYSQLGTSYALERLIFVVHVSFSIFATRYELCSWKAYICRHVSFSIFATRYELCSWKAYICSTCFVSHIRNSVRVVLLKAPRWRAKWAYVGIKWPHEMNPERVQLLPNKRSYTPLISDFI